MSAMASNRSDLNNDNNNNNNLTTIISDKLTKKNQHQ